MRFAPHLSSTHFIMLNRSKTVLEDILSNALEPEERY